jgi:hypothetical protein
MDNIKQQLEKLKQLAKAGDEFYQKIKEVKVREKDKKENDDVKLLDK